MQADAIQVRLHLYLEEDDLDGERPLYETVLEKAKKAGISGATVLRAVAGYGRSGRTHHAGIVDIGEGLPLMIEIVDKRGKVEALLETLRPLLKGRSASLHPVEFYTF